MTTEFRTMLVWTFLISILIIAVILWLPTLGYSTRVSTFLILWCEEKHWIDSEGLGKYDY